MKHARTWAGIAVGVVLALGLVRACRRPVSAGQTTAVVAKGEFSVWSAYDGILDARRVENISSRMGGAVTVVELAPEGSTVKQGDLLARFDSFQIEADVTKLENDYAVAKSELEGLEKAELPMELHDLGTQLLEAQFNLNSERQYLEDSRDLLKQELVSEQEVAQQELKVKSLESKLAQIENRMKLTREHLHPSKLERSRARLAASEQHLKQARQQLERCTITAPAEGIVAYLPAQLFGGYRSVRVGDTIYRNQVFMRIPDMSELLVRCYVPEADLGRVQPGMKVFVTPLAYPDLKLDGEVESVGAMAEERMGYPSWQKYFHVVVRLAGTDPRLRTGISATVSVLSYHCAEAVLIPRTAVRWEGQQATCIVRASGGRERPLKLGRANDQFYEVLEGVKPGERVVIP